MLIPRVAAETVAHLAGMEQWLKLAGPTAGRPLLVYGGEMRQSRAVAEVVPWRKVGEAAGRRLGPHERGDDGDPGGRKAGPPV